MAKAGSGIGQTKASMLVSSASSRTTILEKERKKDINNEEFDPGSG